MAKTPALAQDGLTDLDRLTPQVRALQPNRSKAYRKASTPLRRTSKRAHICGGVLLSSPARRCNDQHARKMYFVEAA